MTTAPARTGLQLRSLVQASGELEISLAEVPVPELRAGDVQVRIEASPLNPSDQGLLFGPADMAGARFSGTLERPVVTARIPETAMKGVAGRLGQPMPVGNEGAGVVVAAGPDAAAQALLGRMVAVIGGGMYAQYRVLPATDCLLLPEGATAAQGASSFINPLTSQGMVETMRREGHTALVHTAAASNLGQMLHRICQQDGVPLVNIVRKPEQAELLRGLGAAHVCVSSVPTFAQDLTDALAATGATIAFDATGGGPLAGQVLACMEAAIQRKAGGTYSRYGSAVHKQVYLYGSLDTGPTTFSRSFGMAWGMGGWLLWPFMQKIGPEAVARLKARVVAELDTTFASHYTREVSLAEALSPAAIAAYGQRSTGAKYLVNPSKGLAAA